MPLPKSNPSPLRLDTDSTVFISKSTDEQIETRQLQAEVEALTQLQNLLVHPEVAKYASLIADLQQKLVALESQIVPKEEIVLLLQPFIRDESSKLTDSLTSTIDTIIQQRTLENKNSMGQAIAPLLSTAISHQIENLPTDIAIAIAPEIAIAIEEQIRLDRGAIATALTSQMSIAIKNQITLERDAMVDALYPIIGSTIAKYMAEVIRSINEKMENALSVEGITRKIRAKIQGTSEAELILKEVTPFQVRAIFLIHKLSGLVISEVQQAGSEILESEMVAGMLTAIRSFVNDCIAQSGDVSEIDAIEYGNSKIILEVAGYCYLAVVVQGEAPQWFIRDLQQSLRQIVATGFDLQEFDGDISSTPAEITSHLEKLKTISVAPKKQSFPWQVIIYVILSVIFFIGCAHQYELHVEQNIVNQTITALAEDPELSIYKLNAHVNHQTLHLSGRLPNEYLRYKTEKIAQSVAPSLKLETDILVVKLPPDPILTAGEVQRVTSLLNQRAGVAIKTKYQQGRVIVQGMTINLTLAQKISQAFEQIPGVHSVINTLQLKSLPLINLSPK